MAEIIKMPKLSDTMEEGVVAKWHKKVGDQVKSGDLLADIETDKATMEFESFEDGVLLHIGVPEGGSAPVESVLAIIGEKGEDFSALLAGGEASAKAAESGETKAEEVSVAPAAEAIDTSKIKANIVKMPKLSDTMTDGVVAKWHKKVGDQVKSGELLAEIETDKATMEFESFEDGVLLHIGVPEGGSAPVESILAIIGEKGADVDTLIKAHGQAVSAPKEETPVIQSAPAPVAAPVQTQTQSAPVAAPAHTGSSSGRVKASPLAKKLAGEKGINLEMVSGTGEGGRIIKRDVENYSGGSGAFAIPAFIGQEKFTEEPVSQMRKTIARRLGESKFTAPHFYLTVAIDMQNAIEARKLINRINDVKISFNDIVIKAAAAALKMHPKVNSSWLGDRIRYNEHVNIGVAVAVDEGLLVPVVRFADGKTLTQISGEVKTYVDKARAKQLQPADWEGSTFTISNLGMFGIEEFTAIINPPDACIMAVGGINEVPIVRDGNIVPGDIMKVTLSCDHRVVDGALGAQFLKTFKQLMENPVLLLGSANI
ncbi:MAG: pyruvate dehydrogenase complex dihydrolipoamide acetyltransferase [Flavobacteriales bacterium]|nr:pyruvate dehydrogenase complex dihydrolipoamide acetyltransferase [Flavobacteriales bacterium]